MFADSHQRKTNAFAERTMGGVPVTEALPQEDHLSVGWGAPKTRFPARANKTWTKSKKHCRANARSALSFLKELHFSICRGTWLNWTFLKAVFNPTCLRDQIDILEWSGVFWFCFSSGAVSMSSGYLPYLRVSSIHRWSWKNRYVWSAYVWPFGRPKRV